MQGICSYIGLGLIIGSRYLSSSNLTNDLQRCKKGNVPKSSV